MPVFEYTAITRDGKKTRGTVDADSIRAARQKLRAKEIFPTDIREETGFDKFLRFTRMVVEVAVAGALVKAVIDN